VYKKQVQRAEGMEVPPPVPLKYEANYVPPVVSGNGWSAPAADKPTHLPFQVHNIPWNGVCNTYPLQLQIDRTPSVELPVYLDYRNGGTRVLTIVRKITGDSQVLGMFCFF
jgi:large subunit ribosomal protein L49